MRYLVGEAMTGGYGDADILHDCTIGVDEGEIAVVVGPNGGWQVNSDESCVWHARVAIWAGVDEW